MQPPTPSDSGDVPRQGSSSHSSERANPRPARSKNGCLTCRRRKVRCDEQRPRCSHCERLNLQCSWRPAYAPTQWKFVGTDLSRVAADSLGPPTMAPAAAAVDPSCGGSSVSPGTLAAVDQSAWLQSPGGGVDQLFDYASFMWTNGTTSDVIGQTSPERPRIEMDPGNDWNMWSGEDSQAGWQNQAFIQDHDLLHYFVKTIVPPILAEVETQKRWSTMRQMLMSMSNASTMVRGAILAFSSLLYYRREAPWMPSAQQHYETALKELLETHTDTGTHASLREHRLATLFFLSYVDILEDRVAGAHEHLKRAYGIFQQGKSSHRQGKGGFRPVEMRLLSWIRLLDARAVSAGGEGLFLSDKGEVEALIVQPPSSLSPGSDATESVHEIKEDGEGGDGDNNTTTGENDMEEVLFQVLYQPGVVFFQKVESFMGRISMIDPWHRSRGTVEDETEVMQTAARISRDLAQTYEDRPALMDPAVAGRLTAPPSLIAASLAVPITRAFRTYLSNYYASKIHLHRVAYKHLPLSRDAADALRQIRRLTHLLVDDLNLGDSNGEGALPVSQLWPLLMLGSEEESPDERAWIRDQILRMEKVATNARITARVLDEVQARQDAAKARVDIRSIMHAIFDSCFAIM